MAPSVHGVIAGILQMDHDYRALSGLGKSHRENHKRGHNFQKYQCRVLSKDDMPGKQPSVTE